MFSKVNSYGLIGLDGFKIDVEIDTGAGLPKFDIVGLPDTAVKESKERVCSAIKNSGYRVPPKKVTINLAPANIKKVGPNFDLPIAVGLLISSEQLEGNKYSDFVIIGELGLNGKLKPINGILPTIIAARSDGFKKFIIPSDNAKEASFIDGISVFALSNLSEVVKFLAGEVEFEEVKKAEWNCLQSDKAIEDFARVKGQKLAKRAIEIAVAGGHNILMVGAPGAGKTMIARCIPSIMPDLTFEEALEITKVHSIAGELDPKKGIIFSRPFRSPHHTATTVALAGGGKDAKPGEVSLASGGVLFLDELPEYARTSLESLRQPLEDGVITVSRALGTFEYPANFMLVASMNPCPCGNYGVKDAVCSCSPSQIQNYLKRLSGPLLDRIDIKIDVERVSFIEMTNKNLEESSAEIKKRVDRARQIQAERFAGTNVHSNAKMNSKMLGKFCELGEDAKNLLSLAFDKYHISARGYTRILKVARTIADLDGAKDISAAHVAEALAYRNIDKYQM